MLMAEESVYSKARSEEQYVTFFKNLFNETSNQSKMILLILLHIIDCVFIFS